MPRKLFLPTLTNVTVRNRAYLPHWEAPDAIYSITYRLADSIPAFVVDQLQQEHRLLLSRARTAAEKILVKRQLERLLDGELDVGRGACHLRDPRIAQIVVENLEHFDRQQYELLAWCVMPNHVHVVIQGLTDLDSILHSWKSYTSKEANKVLGRVGVFWYREYFDRIVRDSEDLRATVEYVLKNPIKAGLRDWRWAGRRPA